ncbi:MAG: ankyrin repeat domain-containing protein [Acidobacteria bacterium]|nr:MAG: ankyrin repeat domain-containing protein [Acidobacteriota bacterium]REK05394.1 MAG: ankyrin repeat domain-containing protein [Acidobacteriota bacterium]
MGSENERLLDAIRGGDADAVRSLLAERPHLAEARDSQGVPLLLQALYHRQTQIAELLAERRRPGTLTVHEAAALGRIERLRELLDGDADAHLAWSHDGFTALHLAAFFAREEAVALLLEHGAAVGFASRNGMHVHPLHSAAAVGNVPICRRLLAAGAAVDARQEGGFTPLMSAALAGNLELLELLLEHGADPAIAAADGRTAIDLASAGGHDEAVARLQRG